MAAPRATAAAPGPALTFSYTVGAGQDVGDLAVTSFNPNGATLQDAAGNNASLSGAVTNPAGTLQIDTTAPAVSVVSAAASTADDGPGTVVRHADRQL